MPIRPCWPRAYKGTVFGIMLDSIRHISGLSMTCTLQVSSNDNPSESGDLMLEELGPKTHTRCADEP